MDHSLISRLLGCQPEESILPNGKELIWYEHSGKLLKYVIMITPSDKQIAISADPVTPFGGSSFYEFYINCDRIQQIANSYNRKNELCLGFWLGDGTDPKERKLTIHMRDDRDLVVWPDSFEFRTSHRQE